jgi:hypothetical protein
VTQILHNGHASHGHLKVDSEGWLKTKLYDKRDDFNFPIVNFPFICSNIQTAPAYGGYISQLVRYSRVCSSHQDFLDRGLIAANKEVTEPRVPLGLYFKLNGIDVINEITKPRFI